MYASILSPACACMCVCVLFFCCWCWHVTREVEQAGLSDLEIISQPVEDENQYLAPPVQLVSFGYRDLPLAALDLSLAGSQLLSNADEDENREGWVKLLLWALFNMIDTFGLFVFNMICLCGKCEWQTWSFFGFKLLFGLIHSDNNLLLWTFWQQWGVTHWWYCFLL